MNRLALLAATVLLARVASAQQPRLSLAASRDLDGALSVSLRNLHTAPVTAYTLRFTRARTVEDLTRTQYQFHDALLEPEDGVLIAARDKGVLKLGFIPGDDLPDVQIVAVVFADGASTGDSAQVSRVIETRRRAYYDIPLALGILKEGGVPQVLIEQFQHWRHRYNDGSRDLEQYFRARPALGWVPPPMAVVPFRTASWLQTITPEEVIRKLTRWRQALEQSEPIL